jgi:hypothetical protein
MTDMPPATDLPSFRERLAAKIGIPVGDIGVLPDQSHLSGGGYHCGPLDIKNIGKLHLPVTSFVGSSTEDYSVRQARDRNYAGFELSHGSNFASAMDVGDGWRAGNAAWIRWNNYILADLRANPARIPGLRAFNFTPDGSVKRRYDTNNPSQGVVSSTDTVLWHTHLEWWRDSILRREAGFQRMLDLADDAIANRPARAFGSAAPTPGEIVTVNFPTFFSCAGDPNSPTFFGTPGMTCSVVGQTEKDSIKSLIDGKWTDAQFASANHSWAAGPPVARNLVNIVGTIPAGYEDRAVDKSGLDTSAIVAGVLQGLANDPNTSVTQADVDHIADAVRAKFTDSPLK